MIKPVLATFLILTLLPLSSPAAADGPASQTLTIAVLQGGGATNNVRTGAVTVPIVEVRDDSMKPVAGAEVTFELPATGPGGTFSGGSAVARSKTNSAGQARAPDFVPGREGRFVIQVNAKLGDRAGATRIAQSNSANTFSTGAVERGRSKIWRVLGIAGGGAITVGLIMLTRGGGGDSSSSGSTGSTAPTITLSPGSVTVGGPR